MHAGGPTPKVLEDPETWRAAQGGNGRGASPGPWGRENGPQPWKSGGAGLLIICQSGGDFHENQGGEVRAGRCAGPPRGPGGSIFEVPGVEAILG